MPAISEPTTKPTTKPTKAAPTAPKPAKSKPAAPPVETRAVKYDKFDCEQCIDEFAMNAERAKELLGWTELPDDAEEYDTKDFHGKKIRLRNNDLNRNTTDSWVKALTGVILHRQFRRNGETIVIGKYGNILSGRHRLLAVIDAKDHWEADPKWKDYWDTEPTIETLVAVGVEEDMDTVNSLDNVKPRTLADVLFCDKSVFANAPRNERIKLCRVVDAAIKMLWERTGAAVSAFSPSKHSHSESVDFLGRHKRLIDAVQIVMNLHKEASTAGKKVGGKNPNVNCVTEWLSLGQAAAVLYLMAASKSDLSKYHKKGQPTEDKLDMSLWNKAVEFWKALTTGDVLLRAVRDAYEEVDYREDGGTGTLDEHIRILTKAWPMFAAGTEIKKADVRLTKTRDYIIDVGNHYICKVGTFGGIDLGRPEEEKDLTPPAKTESKATTTKEEKTLTPDEEAKRKADIQKTKDALKEAQARKEEREKKAKEMANETTAAK